MKERLDCGLDTDFSNIKVGIEAGWLLSEVSLVNAGREYVAAVSSVFVTDADE